MGKRFYLVPAFWAKVCGADRQVKFESALIYFADENDVCDYLEEEINNGGILVEKGDTIAIDVKYTVGDFQDEDDEENDT